MYLKTKLTKSGNSWCVRLSKDALALSGLKPGETVVVEVRPRRLILRKLQQADPSRLNQSYKDVQKVWEQALKDAWLQIFGSDRDD